MPSDSFGSCPPPRSKSRRSTMFAFRKNRTLVVSRSPESFIPDTDGSSENSSPNENMLNQNSSLSPDKTSSHRKPMYTPSPPSSSVLFSHRSPVNEGSMLKLSSPTSSDHTDTAPSSRLTAQQRPQVKLLSPISSLTPPKAEIVNGGKLSIESSVSDLPLLVCPPSTTGASSDGSSSNAALQEKDALIARLKRKVIRMREQRQQHLDMVVMSREETESVRFLNAIQELKIEELTSSLSLNAIEKQEALTQRNKKYKQALSKLKQEKEAYEQRANGVIAQLNEQMTSLQTVAMERITFLEKELMAVHRDNEELRKASTRGGDSTEGSELRREDPEQPKVMAVLEAEWVDVHSDEESREECDSEEV
ncbi:hypothetical protein EON64_08575 [archaeon]|nr:MAG: hypothetical protein EON64_08575 [archaeon]